MQQFERSLLIFENPKVQNESEKLLSQPLGDKWKIFSFSYSIKNSKENQGYFKVKGWNFQNLDNIDDEGRITSWYD